MKQIKVDKEIWSLQFTEIFDNEKHSKEIHISESYVNKIHECLAKLTKIKQNSNQSDQSRSLLRSPIAPLPEFSGSDHDDYTKFISSFEETISKFKYSNYDKYLLLRQQTKDRARVLIDSLESTEQSYQCAKKLLEEAFASPITQKFNVIRKVSQMKLSKSDDPFYYVGQMRTLKESVTNLNIDVESFLQYFYWHGLNKEFQTQVIHIVNKTEPSLKELNDNFFDAIKRYQRALNDKNNSNKNVTNFCN